MAKKEQSKAETKITEWQKEVEKEIRESEQEVNVEIPQQAEFFKTPVRFGNIPVDVLPLGCDSKEQYRKLYPKISLPFQTIEKISFGHQDLEPNQLIFGDNLHVMRALPSNSIDLIYIDPPFFSGKHYNIIFGDQNEIRSFSDIWEGGMPGYLTWLNARLLEIKRLLKPAGAVFIHCDYHAGHYIKVELDKIFGYNNFRNQIIWKRTNSPKAQSKNLGTQHDYIFYYTKSDEFTFNKTYRPLDEKKIGYHSLQDENGKFQTVALIAGGIQRSPNRRVFDFRGVKAPWLYSLEHLENFWKEGRIYKTSGGLYRLKKYLHESPGSLVSDLWVDEAVAPVQGISNELIGYPTQKPESLLKRIIELASKPGDIVADFFCGGGTTPAVAQKSGRRWIATDISKIAVSVTRDRILRDISGKNGNSKEVQNKIEKTPNIEIKNWGVYEVPEIVKMNEDTFRNFIISAFNGNLASFGGLIHGYKNKIPIFVGSPSQEKPVTEKEVVDFAKHIVKTREHHQGTMIAWGFTPGAKNVAQQLEAEHSVSIDFVKLQLIPIESQDFKEHITSKHPEYKNLLKFILPPQVSIIANRISLLEYEFDVSESVSLNPTGKIINVQWDFSYDEKRFVSTPGYSFFGIKNNKPVLKVSYKFKSAGKMKIACRVQDDEGGEKTETMETNIK